MILNDHAEFYDVHDCTILIESTISVVDGNGACKFDSGENCFLLTKDCED